MIISHEAVVGFAISIRIPDFLSAFYYVALRSIADIGFTHNICKVRRKKFLPI